MNTHQFWVDALLGILRVTSSDSKARSAVGAEGQEHINQVVRNVHQPIFNALLAKLLARKDLPIDQRAVFEQMSQSIKKIKAQDPTFLFLGRWSDAIGTAPGS